MNNTRNHESLLTSNYEFAFFTDRVNLENNLTRRNDNRLPKAARGQIGHPHRGHLRRQQADGDGQRDHHQHGDEGCHRHHEQTQLAGPVRRARQQSGDPGHRRGNLGCKVMAAQNLTIQKKIKLCKWRCKVANVYSELTILPL